MSSSTSVVFKALPIAIVLAAPAGEALAKDATPTLPTIEVFAANEAIKDRKASRNPVIVLSEEELQRYADATVGDVLRRLPGMTFTGPAGVVKDIRMRGMDKGNTQILINGEPVPTGSKERQIQVDRLPADMIERIEIIRSPSAAMDSNSVGGAINIVLKKAVGNEVRLRASAGRNGDLQTGDALLQVGRQFGNLNALLALSHTQGAENVEEAKSKFNATGDVTESEQKYKPVKKTETLFSPRLNWQMANGTLTLEPFISDGNEKKTEMNETRSGAGELKKSTASNEEKDDRIYRLGGRYDGHTAWGNWFAKAGIQQGETQKDKSTQERNGVGTVTKRSTDAEKTRDNLNYVGAGLSFSPHKRHLVSLGTELRQGEFTIRQSKTENGADKSSPKDGFRIKEDTLIAYVQDEWQIKRKHFLTPGLRVQHVEREAFDGNGLQQDGKQTSSNPSLQYLWQMTPRWNLRSSMARTQKLPKYDDLNPLVETKAGSLTDPDKSGNPDLNPETSMGFDVGIEHFMKKDRGVIGLNAYRRNVKDFIEKETAQEGDRFVKRPQNVGEANFMGLELDLRVPVMRGKKHDLYMTGSHTEMRGEVRDGRVGIKRDVKDLPKRVSNLGLDWKFHPAGVGAGFQVNYQPGFTSDSFNADGIREIKARSSSTLLDAYIRKSLTRSAEVRLVAKNILSVEKDENTTKFKANGSFDNQESKTETSKPTIYLTLDLRF